MSRFQITKANRTSNKPLIEARVLSWIFFPRKIENPLKQKEGH